MNDEFAGALKNNISNSSIVHVCGLGGAGKTRFCHSLEDRFGGTIVYSDWYLKYSSKERRRRIREAVESGDPSKIEQEENPKNWYDWRSLVDDLEKLKSGKKVKLKGVWNQKSGEKDSDIELKPKPDSLIWCDGIYLLHRPIVDIADARILLTASLESVRQRAELRDKHRSAPDYLAYKEHLMHKYDIPYFEKNKSSATLVIDNSDFKRPKIIS